MGRPGPAGGLVLGRPRPEGPQSLSFSCVINAGSRASRGSSGMGLPLLWTQAPGGKAQLRTPEALEGPRPAEPGQPVPQPIPA